MSLGVEWLTGRYQERSGVPFTAASVALEAWDIYRALVPQRMYRTCDEENSDKDLDSLAKLAGAKKPHVHIDPLAPASPREDLQELIDGAHALLSGASPFKGARPEFYLMSTNGLDKDTHGCSFELEKRIEMLFLRGVEGYGFAVTQVTQRPVSCTIQRGEQFILRDPLRIATQKEIKLVMSAFGQGRKR